MNDQAATLRVIRGDRTTASPPVRRERAIAITGGKGGVGKSSIATNLAVAYAATGARTLIVDADLGMADLNLLLGVAPDKSILDALAGTPIEDILVGAHGVQLLPALNGSYQLATLGPRARRDLFTMIETLSTRFDTLILDVAAGIGATQTAFAGAASEAVVVVTPEPLSLADAYACLKVLRTEHGLDHAYVLPNRVSSREQASEISSRLTALVDRFLDLQLIELPSIPADPALADSAHAGVPVVLDRPDAPSARAIRMVARALDALVGPERRPDSARRFWHRMFSADVPGDSP